jgi:hypothetical protein
MLLNDVINTESDQRIADQRYGNSTIICRFGSIR